MDLHYTTLVPTKIKKAAVASPLCTYRPAGCSVTLVSFFLKGRQLNSSSFYISLFFPSNKNSTTTFEGRQQAFHTTPLTLLQQGSKKAMLFRSTALSL